MYWTVAQVETQRERIAHIALIRANFKTYLPRIQMNNNRIAPLFPGYIFVEIVDRWWPVRWSPGIISVLMSGDRPAHVTDEIIAEIQKREVGGFVKLPKQDSGKRRGQKVKIIRGSFEGQLAIYDGMSGKERERVLLELLGQMVLVELPSRDVLSLDIARSV
jgi:transcription antitermination factor NusG